MTFSDDERDVIRKALIQYEQRLDELADHGVRDREDHLRGARSARRIRARIDAMGPPRGLAALAAAISARLQA